MGRVMAALMVTMVAGLAVYLMAMVTSLGAHGRGPHGLPYGYPHGDRYTHGIVMGNPQGAGGTLDCGETWWHLNGYLYVFP